MRVSALPLSSRRARELALAAAWSRVAGPEIAARVAARAAGKGVLVLTPRDERWARAVVEWLPTLAARLAERHPELAVSRFRIEVAGAPRRATPIEDVERREVPTVEPAAAAPVERPVEPAGAERLTLLRARYLARQKS